ncbi:carbohydrate ABC transporter permease [Vallitalea sp.]|uniref:carbohydrate ABC transporter permease n=1 Tax=Vallitalea sp. TaxID=1882829 RepID=UPI0025F36395|nr:sugar ABC transporter permease [Vallitalea sp.]MCT4687219.1 sugar ABC transporter permease [Vallitalea sp.]
MLQNSLVMKNKVSKKQKKEMMIAYLFLLPALLVIGIFVITPICKLFYTSMRSTDLMGGNDIFIGLKNYSDLVRDAEFIRSFKASLYFMIIVMPLQTALALFMAIQVNKKIKGAGIYRSIYFLPVVTSFLVIAYLWKFMYNTNFGLINEILNVLHITRVNFLGNTNTAMNSIIVACIWKSWAFFMMIYLAGLKEIPVSLYESAAIDGVNSWQKFRYITFPMLKKTTLFIVMITSMDAFVKVFVPVFAMTQGGPRGTTNILVFHIWRQAFRLNQVGYASAAAVIMFLFVLIMSIIQFKIGDDKE